MQFSDERQWTPFFQRIGQNVSPQRVSSSECKFHFYQHIALIYCFEKSWIGLPPKSIAIKKDGNWQHWKLCLNWKRRQKCWRVEEARKSKILYFTYFNSIVAAWHELWVSASDAGSTAGQFHWADGTPVDESIWFASFPKNFGAGIETCAFLHTRHAKLWDWTCAAPTFFLCQLPDAFSTCLWCTFDAHHQEKQTALKSLRLIG